MIQIDMKMPSSCYNCPFIKNERTNDYGSFCECGILEDYETINLLEHSKHPNCPLIEQELCPDAVSRQEIMKAFAELPHEYENAEQRARTGGIAACQVIVEYAQPVMLTRSIDGNVSTEECLDAVKKIKTYLSRNEKSCSSTDWRDRNNKGFDTDMGYFYEGLDGLEKYLEDKKG